MFLRECGQPVSSLRGAGPKITAELETAGISSIADLLLYLPRGYEDRLTRRPIAAAMPEGLVNTIVEVVAHDWIGFGQRRTLKVAVRDESGYGYLLCFGRNFLQNTLVIGGRFRLFGSFQYRYGEFQCSVFDTEPESREPSLFSRVLPIYPLRGSLTQGVFRKLMTQAVSGFGAHVEPELPEGLARSRGLLQMSELLKQTHFPDTPGRAEEARRSLAYHELFFLQLVVARRSASRAQVQKTRAISGTALAERLLKRLPFSLTPDQETTLREIREDLSKPFPMARLVQGEVGSGKTLVAFIAALYAIEGGAQAVLMAPTELLARQHADTAARLLSPLGISVAYLSGTIRDSGRNELLRNLEAGGIDLLIGTHAVFSPDVAYHNLGLVIVDEQHRFGVLQRVALTEKGRSADLLLLTATPIPRTLALTAFGDLSVSSIRTMPAGRKPTQTHLAVHGKEEKVYRWVADEIRRGRQAYFVYPLIGESEKLSLRDAETMYRRLSEKVFPGVTVGLIHSRLPEENKREIMASFTAGKTAILVATSVVEVGVDVPNATCMVVEHAERFGLSALHQLRGRVGRGTEQSYFFLVYDPALTEDAKRRLMVMKESSDGFMIAEEDLRIRGPGEILGVRQSGEFRLLAADLTRDADLLEHARDDAMSIVESDPGFLKPGNEVLREVFRRARPYEDDFLEGG